MEITLNIESSTFGICNITIYGCFLKWWNTPISHPKCWSFLVGKAMVVGETQHFWKPPYMSLLWVFLPIAKGRLDSLHHIRPQNPQVLGNSETRWPASVAWEQQLVLHENGQFIKGLVFCRSKPLSIRSQLLNFSHWLLGLPILEVPGLKDPTTLTTCSFQTTANRLTIATGKSHRRQKSIHSRYFKCSKYLKNIHYTYTKENRWLLNWFITFAPFCFTISSATSTATKASGPLGMLLSIFTCHP